MNDQNRQWLSDAEANLFAKILERVPIENRRGRPYFRPLSFYSSELKAASAILERLEQISVGKISQTDLSTGSVKRYTNTLRNLGLIAEDELVLSSLGESILRLPRLADASQIAVSVDGVIFRGLAKNLLSTFRAKTIPRSATFFAPFVLNARDFFEPIPRDLRDKMLEDDDQLLLLQLIFSHGPEVNRFWHLEARSRSELVSAFIRSYRRRPVRIPKDKSRSFYLYTSALARKAVQPDIRNRVRGLLTAYLNLATSNPSGLNDLVSAAKIVLGGGLAPLLHPASNVQVVETEIHALPAESEGQDSGNPLQPLPPVSTPEELEALPLARQHRGSSRPRVSGRDAVVRRFSKRAQEYGRWAEACVLKSLQERERRGEISSLTWRSDIGETPGWDIDYVEIATNTLKCIEVKGTKLPSIDVVDLTANEMATLNQHRDNYALAIVTSCAHANRRPKLYFLWNPAAYFEREGIKPQTAIWTVRLGGR